MENRGDRTHLEFDIPSRGLMGLRSNLLTATQGEAVVAHRFKDYEPYKGDIERRTNGSLVSLETGVSVAYSMELILAKIISIFVGSNLFWCLWRIFYL